MTSCPPLSKVLCLGLALLCAAPASAREVDLDKLWLPKSYQGYLPRLYDAARKVKAYPRCGEFLEGTSHLGRTKPDHPVFTLTCREPGGQTFNVVVDGPSLKAVDETREGGLVSFDQLKRDYEREQERAEALRRREEQIAELRAWLDWWEAENLRREQLWLACVEALKERVGRMEGLEWLTRTRPAPQLSEELSLDDHPDLQFHLDFNAVSYRGEDLRYRARCERAESEEDGGGDVVLDIGARRDAESD